MDLITDRTLTDVERVAELRAKGWHNMTDAEKSEWISGMKGAYNYIDLNRVESAVQEVAEILGLSVTVKTDWAVTDIPSESDMKRYLDNIKMIRNSGALDTTPEAPESMSGLTYEMANAIEQILIDIEIVIKTYCRCGDVFCGEV